MKIIFLGNDSNTAFNEFGVVAERLYELDTSRDITFVSNKLSAQLFLNKLIKQEIVSHVYFPESDYISLRLIKKLSCFAYLRKILKLSAYFCRHLHLIAWIKPIIQGADVVITYSDRSDESMGAGLKWARKYDIPILELQVATYDPYFIFNTRKKKPEYSLKGMNVLFYLFAQKNVKEIDSIKLVYFPLYKWLILSVFGMLPIHPWIMGRNGTSQILCFDDRQRTIRVDEGIAEDVAVTIGHISFDMLYASSIKRESLRLTLLEDLFGKIPNGARVVVVAAPHLYEHGLMSLEEAIAEIKYILSVTRQLKDTFVLWSLHPKMNFENYEFINYSKNSRIVTKEKLNVILPVADLFIAMFKSTVFWAEALGIQTVLLNYLDLGVDPRDLSQTKIILEKGSLVPQILLHMLNSDEIRRKSEFLDGQVINRIDQYIKQATEI